MNSYRMVLFGHVTKGPVYAASASSALEAMNKPVCGDNFAVLEVMKEGGGKYIRHLPQDLPLE